MINTSNVSPSKNDIIRPFPLMIDSFLKSMSSSIQMTLGSLRAKCFDSSLLSKISEPPSFNFNLFHKEEVVNNLINSYNSAKVSFIEKKRERELIQHKKVKKSKRKEQSLIRIKLNQIYIKNTSLKYYPLLSSINENDFTIELVKRMFEEYKYFDIITNKNYYQKISTVNESNDTMQSLFLEEKDKLNLYKIKENETEVNPFKLLHNYYKNIKLCVLTIQKNFKGKKKQSLNEVQCEILVRLIQSCNIISEFILSKRETTIQNNNYSSYPIPRRNGLFECEFCHHSYKTGQSLGGHISRVHPNQSNKYKQKIEKRNERELNRKALFEIKKKLFKKYNLDLEYLIGKNQKKYISSFLKQHKVEYLKLRKEKRSIN